MVRQPHETPEAGQVRGYIKLIGQALDADDPATAKNYIRNALEIIKPPPEWTVHKIRQALKNYLDRLVKNNPPELDNKAQIALGILHYSDLQNAETLDWERKFKLTRAHSLLEAKQIDQSFELFAELLTEAEQVEHPEIQRQIKTDISSAIRTYISQNISQQNWTEPYQVIERLKTTWPSTDEHHGWLVIISQFMATVGQEQQITQKLQTAHRAQRRSLNFARILLFIFMATVLAYTLVIIR